MSDTISKIKLSGVTYTIDDLSKASIESVLEFGEITSENNSLLTFANSKLDELLNRINGSIKSQDFYKCASVDVDNKMWTGYKAIFSDGAYSFEDAVTEGLNYGGGLTPVVDGIYDIGALVQVSKLYRGNIIPEEGLVFHALLQDNYDDIAGNASVTVSNCTFETVDGISCMKAENGTYAQWTPTGEFPSGTDAMSMFICFRRMDTSGYCALTQIHSGGSGSGFSLHCYNGKLYAEAGEPAWAVMKNDAQLSIPPYEWHTLALTRVDGTYYTYYDGELVQSYKNTFNSVGSQNIVAGYDRVHGYKAFGHFSNFLVYNRALSAEEVKGIHNTVMG